MFSACNPSFFAVRHLAVRHIHYPVNQSSDHFHTDAVVISSDHCCTDTVVSSSDHCCIETVAPSGDHCFTKTVESSSGRYWAQYSIYLPVHYSNTEVLRWWKDTHSTWTEMALFSSLFTGDPSLSIFSKTKL